MNKKFKISCKRNINSILFTYGSYVNGVSSLSFYRSEKVKIKYINKLESDLLIFDNIERDLELINNSWIYKSEKSNE